MTQVAIILLTFTPYHPGSLGLRFIYLIWILLYCVFVALKKLCWGPSGDGCSSSSQPTPPSVLLVFPPWGPAQRPLPSLWPAACVP